mmetsp:Transcript_21090/g.68231  ORF Transcript_21090/g.68231 Transcript_21090/m.68231 type:complete len:299 (+) Transcript_21090:326-1222(+)
MRFSSGTRGRSKPWRELHSIDFTVTGHVSFCVLRASVEREPARGGGFQRCARSAVDAVPAGRAGAPRACGTSANRNLACVLGLFTVHRLEHHLFILAPEPLGLGRDAFGDVWEAHERIVHVRAREAPELTVRERPHVRSALSGVVVERHLPKVRPWPELGEREPHPAHVEFAAEDEIDLLPLLALEADALGGRAGGNAEERDEAREVHARDVAEELDGGDALGEAGEDVEEDVAPERHREQLEHLLLAPVRGERRVVLLEAEKVAEALAHRPRQVVSFDKLVEKVHIVTKFGLSLVQV